MASYANSFTAVGLGAEFSIKRGDSFSYAITGTFSATWSLQMRTKGGWVVLATGTSTASATVTAEQDARYRVVCTAYTSGTMVSTITESVGAGKSLLVANVAGRAKAGATAGWVVAAADNLALVTLPASQTASTLVVPIYGLRVGQRITGFYATGQIESAGGTVTLDVALRKHTAAAADVADAAVAAITQLSVTADTIISSDNTRKNDFIDQVGVDETFYFLITATTAGSTDIALQSITLELEG